MRSRAYGNGVEWLKIICHSTGERWFDETKEHFSDPRHRAIRHHSQGIGWLQDTFGMSITLSTCETCGNLEDHERHQGLEAWTYDGLDPRSPQYHRFRGKVIPTRWIGEQHCQEDFGRIPTIADFLREMTVQPWMVRGARKLSREISQSDQRARTEELEESAARRADTSARLNALHTGTYKPGE